MPASVRSPADILNLALRGLGYRWRVSDLYDGSAAATVALDIYAQARDALLAAKDWPFALREVVLVVAPAVVAPSPWAFEYSYPTDCLRIRYVRPGPLTGAGHNLNPQPVLFRQWNDHRPATPIRSILCDLGNPAPILIYTGQVTDMTLWEPGFVDTLVNKIKPALALSLENSLDLAKMTETLQTAADDMTAPLLSARPQAQR